MSRCLFPVAAALALTWPIVACAQSTRPIPIPVQSLRGEMAFGRPPQVQLNGQPAQLAPGARIKDTNNLLVLSGTLAGQTLIVNYTFDKDGLIKDVWLLRSEELAQDWPKTMDEATQWTYDTIGHVWVKP